MNTALRFSSLLLFLLSLTVSTFAQAANGKLQIHFMDVGQGDGVILVSPQGQTVLFDGGRSDRCDLPLSYLQQMGISNIDFLIISHYHADHFGCTPPELQEFPLVHEALDRGFNYGTAAYTDYIQAVGSHRTSLTAPGRKITLDAASATPVVIEVIALNGNGVTTDNENDLSLVALVTFGKFKAEIGGDLSGFAVTRNFGSNVVEYKDIETSVAPLVGPINVYKVHHHCSAYSSNEAWLAATRPQIGVISSGDGNTYGHPATDCVQRLHAANIQKLYWTERGAGASPVPGLDVIGGNIIVEIPSPGTGQYSVTYSGTRVDTYTIPSTISPRLPGGPNPTTAGPVYMWSKKAKVYHYANCSYVRNISPDNIQQGDTPPQGKRLHTACPIVHTSPDSNELTDVPRPPN